MAEILVVKPGLLTTVQDLGRRGFAHLGVPCGGAMDGYALRWAQRLAGLPETGAVLEITLLGPTLEVRGQAHAALAGAELGAVVNGVAWPAGETRNLRTGDTIAFRSPRKGLRAYIAFRGGTFGDLVLGSRSTDLHSGVGGIGGRALQAGDLLEVGEGLGPLVAAPVSTIFAGGTVRVLAGPRHDRFPRQALEILCEALYRVTAHSDRVGMRLEGERIPEAAAGMPSEGVPLGGVEVPPSGQPIVLLQGRGTVGGYPVLATAIQSDLPVFAQRRPGESLRFQLVDPEEARTARVEVARLLALPLRHSGSPGGEEDSGGQGR